MFSTATFDVSIYKKSVGLIKSYLIEKDWDEVEAYHESLKAQYSDCDVLCVEFEGDRGQYENWHEIQD